MDGFGSRRPTGATRMFRTPGFVDEPGAHANPSRGSSLLLVVSSTTREHGHTELRRDVLEYRGRGQRERELVFAATDGNVNGIDGYRYFALPRAKTIEDYESLLRPRG